MNEKSEEMMLTDKKVLARAMRRKPEPITTVASAPGEAPVEEEASTFTAH
jgi:hypothetical protein